MTPLGRQDELLAAQLRELLILPSSSSSPPANKLEPTVGPSAGAAGSGPPPAAAAPSTATASGGRRRRRGSSKQRDDHDHDEVTGGEHHDPAAAAARPRRHYCKRRRRKKQQSGTSMVVTSAPDLFGGYQWRKYGQKLIEGAMYPRSYYRCTRSAEQGCAAKRTVQRNDDADSAAAAPKYTVVRVGEHTCTANDSPEEAPVILETTALVVPAASCTSNPSTAPTSSSAAASCSATTAGTESPAISDNTWSTIASSRVSDCYIDDYYSGLFAAVDHDNNDWVPAMAAAPPSSPSSFPRIEDFAGPIRSPVHISAADGWTIDLDHQLLLQLVNEHTVCQHL